MEPTIVGGRLGTPRVQPTSPRQQQLPFQKCTMSWHLQFTRCTLDRRRASAWVGSSMELTIDCGRLVTPGVRPRSPRQQQLPSQVPADMALGFTRCTLDRRRASACVGSSMEFTIDCGRLVTPNVRQASPRQQQLPAQVPEVGTSVHAVYAQLIASERVGGLKYESTIDCGRLGTTRVRPASPRQQQLSFQVHDELALTVHAVYARPK